MIGVVAFYLWRGDLVPETDVNVLNTPAVDEISAVPEEPETLTGSDTFANLFKLGRTLECTFTFKDDEIATAGTGFFEGTNMRVDSMYVGDDKTTYTSNMISDGAMMYLWSKTADGDMAVKMAVPKDGVTSNTEPVDQSRGGLNPQSKVTYDCKPWIVDGSVFVPPADLDFMDMTAMQNKMMGAPPLPRQ